MNIKPLSSNIFLEPVEEEKVTKSGIVLPETSGKGKSMKGKVAFVGPGKVNKNGERVEVSIKAGDLVIFKEYGFNEIELDGKKYLVGDEDDILAIIG